MNTIDTQVFDLVKIKPFTQLLNISPSRFSQKLRGYKIKGKTQSFTPEEVEKIKSGLAVLCNMLEEESKTLTT